MDATCRFVASSSRLLLGEDGSLHLWDNETREAVQIIPAKG